MFGTHSHQVHHESEGHLPGLPGRVTSRLPLTPPPGRAELHRVPREHALHGASLHRRPAARPLCQNSTLYETQTRKVRFEIRPLLSSVPMRVSGKYLYTTIYRELKNPKPAPSFSAQRECFLKSAPSSTEFPSFGIIISRVKADSPPFHLALIYFSLLKCSWFTMLW